MHPPPPPPPPIWCTALLSYHIITSFTSSFSDMTLPMWNPPVTFCIMLADGCSLSLTPLINPSNAEATYAQSSMTQKSLKTILTLSCWYSLNSSRWVLSDEYPFARVSIIFQNFCIILYGPNKPRAALVLNPQSSPYMLYHHHIIPGLVSNQSGTKSIFCL